MARWDNESLVFQSASNMACKGCALIHEHYLKATCDAYDGKQFTKPSSIAYNGGPCEYYKAAE